MPKGNTSYNNIQQNLILTLCCNNLFKLTVFFCIYIFSIYYDMEFDVFIVAYYCSVYITKISIFKS